MKHLLRHSFLVAISTLSIASAVASSEPIVLMSPPEYQVFAISPNGKWATGIFTDYSNISRGFLWNLESDTFELLSTSESSSGWSVANDGTVCGSFNDSSVSDIGATTEMPGYYRDGNWHSVEIPQGFSGPEDNYHGAGQGYAISADGKTMVGALYINGDFSPVVWYEGAITHLLDITNTDMQGGAPYCISADGTLVGGWSYRYNRSSTIWNLNNGGSRTLLPGTEGPWASVNRFSPDGKKAIYGGGWDLDIDPEAEEQMYLAIYDVETGEVTKLPHHTRQGLVNLFGISNSYTCVGSTAEYTSGRAVVYPNGQGPAIYIEDYLGERGVDFNNLGLYTPEGYERPIIFRAQDISADDNIFALLSYTEQGLCSIIVMLNQDSEHAAPLDVRARQLSGISTAEVTWSAPVRSAEAIQGYRIYRNGEKIAEVGALTNRYYDPSLAYEQYTYTVASYYADGTEMPATAPALSVRPQLVARPEGFTIRQKGAYSIQADWTAPGTNMINKSWYNTATADLRGFGIGIDDQTIEVGIGFEQEEMACYEGYYIHKVNFYPMSDQPEWVLNIYQYDGETPVRIYSQRVNQDLVYKQRNTVVLDQPIPVPTEGDVIVAFEVFVPFASMNVIGIDNGHYKAGYSDLLRLSYEPDFYSYYYASLENGYPDYTSFMIDVVLGTADQDESSDQVIGYTVSLDDVDVATVTDLSWKSDKVSQGNHKVGVKALFADGKVSDAVESDLQIAYAYKPVSELFLENQGTEISLEWEAPLDDDRTEITYAKGNPQPEGIVAPEETNYSFLAGVEYGQKMLAPYAGYAIHAFRFFPTANANFTFMLVSDDNSLFIEVPVYDYALGVWNTVVLDGDIQITPNTTYFLMMDCYDVEADQPALAIDNRLPLAGTSDLVSLDGEQWSSITLETGLSGNWMLSMVLAEPNAEPMPVDGYDVRIDGSTVASKITETKLTYDLGERIGGEHTAVVNTFYTGRAVAVTGTLVRFEIDASGLQSVAAESYRLTRGTDVLSIEGADVRQIAIHATDGKVVARARGAEVGISALPAGIYIVKATTPVRELTYKVVIE